MFYYASSIMWFFASPVNLLIFFVAAGLCALFTRRERIGRILLSVAAIAFVLCGFGPVGAILLRPLEDRFPLPAETLPQPTGIIVLGGALKAEMTTTRGVIALGGEGGRVTEGVVLARRYPEARIVFSGGPAGTPPHRNEARVAQEVFARLGVARERILIEDQSRNTDENALFTRNLAMPAKGERWLLVTSAAHMPRAVGTFRHAGMDVIAYPTDYFTLGIPSDFWHVSSDPIAGFTRLDIAVHEWMGLIAYRLTGKTGTLMPAPEAR